MKLDFDTDLIPCLHRIHFSDDLTGAHGIQASFGMSIHINHLIQKLRSFAEIITDRNKKVGYSSFGLITIDDGHKEVLKLIPILAKFKNLQPILFLTGRQMSGDCKALPLTALYSWCSINGKDPDCLMDDFRFDRMSLKRIRQSEQELLLREAGISIDPPEERMLSLKDIAILQGAGWIIGYHGPEHCDLRIISNDELLALFEGDLKVIDSNGFTKCLAWPEGWWNCNISDIACRAGFSQQFGLGRDRYISGKKIVAKRIIWK